MTSFPPDNVECLPIYIIVYYDIFTLLVYFEFQTNIKYY